MLALRFNRRRLFWFSCHLLHLRVPIALGRCLHGRLRSPYRVALYFDRVRVRMDLHRRRLLCRYYWHFCRVS